jgi:hypothetical protein
MSDLLSVTGPTARMSLRAGGLVDGPRRDGPERPGQPAPLPQSACPAGLPDLAVVLGLLQQPGDALVGVVGSKLRVRRVHDGASLLLGQQNFMRRP